MINVLDRAYEHPLPLEEGASMPLAGGIMQYGHQCGMVWGGALAAGAEAYRLHGPGPKAETAAVIAAQRLLEAFRASNKGVNCLEITGTDLKSAMQSIKYFLFKGGVIGCFRMAARSAPIVFNAIDAALSEEPVQVPSPPVSCTAILAGKMGASDLQTVMAAGLAGGIGLCGGACGALGAAIWITVMRVSEEEEKKPDYKDPRALALIDRFQESTDMKFECSEIVGRKFENVDDHAGYLRDGGCSELIEELATAVTAE